MRFISLLHDPFVNLFIGNRSSLVTCSRHNHIINALLSLVTCSRHNHITICLAEPFNAWCILPFNCIQATTVSFAIFVIRVGSRFALPIGKKISSLTLMIFQKHNLISSSFPSFWTITSSSKQLATSPYHCCSLLARLQHNHCIPAVCFSLQLVEHHIAGNLTAFYLIIF